MSEYWLTDHHELLMGSAPGQGMAVDVLPKLLRLRRAHSVSHHRANVSVSPTRANDKAPARSPSVPVIH